MTKKPDTILPSLHIESKWSPIVYQGRNTGYKFRYCKYIPETQHTKLEADSISMCDGANLPIQSIKKSYALLEGDLVLWSFEIKIENYEMLDITEDVMPLDDDISDGWEIEFMVESGGLPIPEDLSSEKMTKAKVAKILRFIQKTQPGYGKP